jgi:hypothetical protein
MTTLEEMRATELFLGRLRAEPEAQGVFVILARPLPSVFIE